MPYLSLKLTPDALFKVPASAPSGYTLTYILVGGGGGSSISVDGLSNDGSGPGDGGYVVSSSVTIQAGNTIVATVGSGGSAGINDNGSYTYGGTGNSSSLSGSSISTITANGGIGRRGATGGYGGGNVNAPSGANGGIGITSSISGVSLYYAGGGGAAKDAPFGGGVSGSGFIGQGGLGLLQGSYSDSNVYYGKVGNSGGIILSVPTSNFNVSNTAKTASFNGGSNSSGVLVVSSVSGTIYVGMKLSGTGVPANTFIISGSGTTWQINNAVIITTTAMTATTLFTNGSNTVYVIPTTQNFYT